MPCKSGTGKNHADCLNSFRCYRQCACCLVLAQCIWDGEVEKLAIFKVHLGLLGCWDCNTIWELGIHTKCMWVFINCTWDGWVAALLGLQHLRVVLLLGYCEDLLVVVSSSNLCLPCTGALNYWWIALSAMQATMFTADEIKSLLAQ